MALIDITTNNLSIQNRNAVTYEDNWVYIPGCTTTGDGSKPYLITSLQQYKSLFGSTNPDYSDILTYEYVAGTLNAGLPVIFRRIVSETPDTEDGTTLLVTKATTSIVKTEGNVTQVTFTDAYGGSYGNSMYVFFRKTGNYYYLDIKYGQLTGKQVWNIPTIETVQIMPVVSDETTDQFNERLRTALKSLKPTRIAISQVNDTATFDLSTYVYNIDSTIGTYDENNIIHLAGGADIDFAATTPAGNTPKERFFKGVAASFATIKDKLLYSPKYLTTGGFCAEETSTKSLMIEKMMELSQLRQDCLALVDLPAGLNDGKNYQDKLTKYGYTQTSASQVLPAAMTVGPWIFTLTQSEYEWMPGSYGYLQVVGRAISTGGKTYTPKAGIDNGKLINTTRTEFPVGQEILEAWQEDNAVNINPVLRIQGGNFQIAGNSTLLIHDENEENLYSEASSIMAVIEIKRFVYQIALQYQYLYNSVEAFENFSLEVAKRLDSMKTEGAVAKYNIINNSTNEEPRTLKILLQVWITPTIKKIEIELNVAYGDIQISSQSEGGSN